MRESNFSRWLRSKVTPAVVANYVTRCSRVEKELHINLDDEYKKDRGVSLLAALTYTKEDQKYNRPLKCKIYFTKGADLKKEMASLKSAVSRYFDFCKETSPDSIAKGNPYDITVTITPEPPKKDINTYPAPIKKQATSTKDSYQLFLENFNISKQELFDWGLSATVFPKASNAKIEWEHLKTRVANNQEVCIRGYGRNGHGTDLYIDLYKELFSNHLVKQDPTNNAAPQKMIATVTGLKRNKDIFNYQVSHIWGHTKNVLLFEAPWNMCYTPKIMDPFTGHETKGPWPKEYQKLFLKKAYELYHPFIKDYNQLLVDLDIQKRLDYYLKQLKGTIPNSAFNQFAMDAKAELSPLPITY